MSGNSNTSASSSVEYVEFSIQHGAHTEQVKIPASMSLATFREGIASRANLEIPSLKLIVQGKMLKLGEMESIDLTQLHGKKARLLGSPIGTAAERAEEARVVAARRAREQFCTEMQNLWNSTIQTKRQILHASRRQAPATAPGHNEMPERRRHGRKFGKYITIATDMKQAFEAMIGIGMAPRIRCNHLGRGTPYAAGCQPCRLQFLREWVAVFQIVTGSAINYIELKAHRSGLVLSEEDQEELQSHKDLARDGFKQLFGRPQPVILGGALHEIIYTALEFLGAQPGQVETYNPPEDGWAVDYAFLLYAKELLDGKEPWQGDWQQWDDWWFELSDRVE